MIYFIQDTSSRAIKIGASRNPLERLADLQTAHHSPLILIGVMEGSYYEEQALHKKFERLQGEWFEPSRALLTYIRDNAITPQSMQQVARVSVVEHIPSTLFVDRLYAFRDTSILVALWVLFLVSLALVAIGIGWGWQAGGYQFWAAIALGVFDALCFALFSVWWQARMKAQVIKRAAETLDTEIAA